MSIIDTILNARPRSSEKLPALHMLSLAGWLFGQQVSKLPQYPVAAVLMHNSGVILYDATHPDAAHWNMPRWSDAVGISFDGHRLTCSIYDHASNRWFHGMRPWVGHLNCIVGSGYVVMLEPPRMERRVVLPSCDPEEIEEGFFLAEKRVNHWFNVYQSYRRPQPSDSLL